VDSSFNELTTAEVHFSLAPASSLSLSRCVRSFGVVLQQASLLVSSFAASCGPSPSASISCRLQGLLVCAVVVNTKSSRTAQSSILAFMAMRAMRGVIPSLESRELFTTRSSWPLRRPQTPTSIFRPRREALPSPLGQLSSRWEGLIPPAALHDDLPQFQKRSLS